MAGAYTLQNRTKAIAFLTVLLLITLVFTFVIGYPFLEPIAYALILATVFHPLQTYLVKRTHRSGLSALISVAIIFLLFIVPVAIMLNIAAIQAASLAQGFAEKSASQGGFVPFIAHLLQRPVEFIGRFVDVSSLNIQEQLRGAMRDFALKLLPTAASWVGNIIGIIVTVVLALVTCYFLLRDGELIVRKTVNMLPVTEAQADRLVQTLKNTIVANVQAVFAVGTAQGIATGVALGILGVNPATLLGILAGICSVIPVVGSGLIWGPAAIYLIVSGKVLKGIVLLGIGVGVVSMLDNIIRPLIVSSRMQANALVLMLAMLGGVHVFGFLGLFVGPVVIAMLVAVGTMLSEEVAVARKEQAQEASVSNLH